MSLFGVCLAETSETVTSLVDVIPPKDHARLIRAFQAAEPYHDLRTAYLIIRALKSLGFSDADKSVSIFFKLTSLLPIIFSLIIL